MANRFTLWVRTLKNGRPGDWWQVGNGTWKAMHTVEVLYSGNGSQVILPEGQHPFRPPPRAKP